MAQKAEQPWNRKKLQAIIARFDQDVNNQRIRLAAPDRSAATEAAAYGEKAIPFIAAALPLSTDAHYALGEIGGYKAFALLAEELKFHNQERVSAAATALANMGDMRAIEPIRNSNLDSMRAGDLISYIKNKNEVPIDDAIDTERPLDQLKEKWTEFNGLKLNLSLSGGHRYHAQQKQALNWLNKFKEQMSALRFNSESERLHAWRMLGILLYYLRNPDDSGIYSACEDAAYCFEQYLVLKPDEKDIQDMLNRTKKD